MIMQGNPSSRRPVSGRVYLVGAGPGDPGLLTVRAARLLRKADVVVHDALVSEAILTLVRPEARLIDVGKRFGGRRTAQKDINRILVEAAATARTVVRLKGGDPFVFGRGGEEALALRDAGVRFQVVPGVTAAVGVAAYAGIPLTHRRLSASVTFVTGHEEQGRGNGAVDWDALARLHGTLAIYMGMTGLDIIAKRLISGGRDPATPAAVIQWGTYRRQRTVEASLASIASVAEAAGIGAPALVVIGEVAALRERIAWFDRAPLHDRRILVARSRAQTSRITSALARLGAEVTEHPRLRALPLSPAPAGDLLAAGLGRYSWLLLTSPAAVKHFWERLKSNGLDSRSLAGVKVASLGLATTRALRSRGIEPELATRTYQIEAVIAALGSAEGVTKEVILAPGEDDVDSPILDALEAAGAAVERVPVFTLVEEAPRHTVPGEDGAEFDVIVLPSSGSVRLAATAVRRYPHARIVAIGPRTAETARKLGIRVDAVAARNSVGGTARAVVRLVRSAERRGAPTPSVVRALIEAPYPPAA